MCFRKFVLEEGLRSHIKDYHEKSNKYNGLRNESMGLSGRCMGKMFPTQSKYDFEQRFNNTDM